MRKTVALAVAAGTLGLLCWLLGPDSRGTRVVGSSPVAEEDETGEVLLAEQPSPSSSEPAASSPRSGEEHAHRSVIAPVRSAPRASAPVRGRLIVAESGDPIAEVFSVRLRTLDLEHKEELLTGDDGTFTSARSYAAGVLLARVKAPDGRELVDHEARFEPSSPDDWLVPVPSRSYPTFARGTVVDRRGAPLGEVPVRLLPLGAALPWIETLSDEHGRFELRNLQGGGQRLFLQGIWERSTIDVQLHAGANELGALALDEPRARLLVRFLCPDAVDFPSALLVVHPAASALAVTFSSWTADDLGNGAYELPLERIPAGTCRVEIEGLDGRSYAPDRAVIEVPGELEIRVSGRAGPGR